MIHIYLCMYIGMQVLSWEMINYVYACGYNLLSAWNWVNSYRKIYGRSNNKRPVAAEMSICNISSQQRCHPHSPNPVGNVVGRGYSAFMELRCQINHQVWCNSIVCHPLKHFIPYKLIKHTQQQQKIHTYWFVILRRRIVLTTRLVLFNTCSI